MSKNRVKWDPYPQEKPPKQMQSYLTTMPKGIVGINTFIDSVFGLYDNEVIAWAELPEPYKEEKNNDQG